MLRTCALLLAATVALAPALASGEASLRLLKSPVPAGGVVRLQLRTSAPVNGEIRGVAALGAVGPFTQTGPNTYEADYSPPAATGPALVAIAAFEDRSGGPIAYALANVAGRVRASTRVRGHAAVYVRAGSRRFGPFHPGRRGQVELRFTANGELSFATVETPQGRPVQKIALKPARDERVVFGRPGRLHPGDSAELYVLTSYAGDLRFEPPRASATAGKVSLDLKGSPSFALRYVLARSTADAGPVTVTFTDSVGARVGSVAFTPAGPAVATIQIKPPAKPLEPGEQAILDVALADAQGRGADGALEITADCGKVEPPLPLGGGLYNVTYVAPQHLPRGETATLHARLLDGTATASAEIALHGGKPAKVVFESPQKKLRAGDVLSVELQVLDAAGNPAQPSDLAIAADHGQVAQVQPEADGKFVVDVRADDDAHTLMLTARDGNTGLSGEADLALDTGPHLPFAVIGPEGGFTNNFGHLSSASISLAGQFLIGPSGPAPVRGTAGFLFGYLPDITQTLTSEQSTRGTLSLSRIPLMARGGAFGGIGNLGLFAGAQAGVLHLSGSLQSPLGTVPLDAWRPAVGLYAGAGYKLGPGYIALEVRATYATVDVTSDNQKAEVSGPVGGIDGALGYLFTL